MNSKFTVSQGTPNLIKYTDLQFFTETIFEGRISPLAFFEAGSASYGNERFYWQNENKTLTLVGIGHAKVLVSHHPENRFEEIATQWEALTNVCMKEEEDIAPVLFGGFSFDPFNQMESEWNDFPPAYFVVPTFQLSIKNGKTAITINLITSNGNAAEKFEKLREERDRLIHLAQLNEFPASSKPIVTDIVERNKQVYLDAVSNIRDLIQDGGAEKVVIARSVQLNFENVVSPGTALLNITNEQQESYHFGFEMNEQLFFGATPERLVEIDSGRAYSACVAGSTPRGQSAGEDRKLGEALLQDPKNREEHQYVVDMISQVFNAYCTNVRIPKTPKLMKLRDIQHLFTPVEGKIESHQNIFNIVEALHPTPALGGVPYDTSIDLIRENERMDRGYYAAPIGWVDTEGNGEFAVALRSALLESDRAYLYAGGGIVADSEPEKEYDETWVKFRPVLRALGGKLNG